MQIIEKMNDCVCSSIKYCNNRTTHIHTINSHKHTHRHFLYVCHGVNRKCAQFLGTLRNEVFRINLESLLYTVPYPTELVLNRIGCGRNFY